MNLSLKIKFKEFLTPLSKEEYIFLEESIKKEGCRDPLLVWKGKDILIDGHHRYKICKKHNIEFQIGEVDFQSEKEAMEAIIGYQFGRRNLTREQKSYIRGKLYNLRKNGWGGDRKSKYKIDNLKNTAEILAKEHMVSTSTITKDAKFAEKLDDLVTEHGDKFRRQVLVPVDGRRRYNKDDIYDLYEESIEDQKEIINLVNSNTEISFLSATGTVGREGFRNREQERKKQKRKRVARAKSSLNNEYEAIILKNKYEETIEQLKETTGNLNDLVEIIEHSSISFNPVDDGYFHRIWREFIEAVKNLNNAVKKDFVEMNLLPLSENIFKEAKHGKTIRN